MERRGERSNKENAGHNERIAGGGGNAKEGVAVWIGKGFKESDSSDCIQYHVGADILIKEHFCSILWVLTLMPVVVFHKQ